MSCTALAAGLHVLQTALTTLSTTRTAACAAASVKVLFKMLSRFPGSGWTSPCEEAPSLAV